MAPASMTTKRQQEKTTNMNMNGRRPKFLSSWMMMSRSGSAEEADDAATLNEVDHDTGGDDERYRIDKALQLNGNTVTNTATMTTTPSPSLGGQVRDFFLTSTESNDFWSLLLVPILVLLSTIALFVWQSKKRRRHRRRLQLQQQQQQQLRHGSFARSSSRNLAGEGATGGAAATTLEQQQLQECESLIVALQEELQAKNTSETEQAILHRQEKRILQGRIQELMQQQEQPQQNHHDGSRGVTETSTNSSIQKETDDKVKELQATVVFLTNLTESQQQTLEAKENEIGRLHNILDEMRNSMGTSIGIGSGTGQEDSTKGNSRRRLSQVPLHPTQVQSELQATLARRFPDQQKQEQQQKDEHNDESINHNDTTDDDDDSISSTSSTESSAVTYDQQQPPSPVSRLEDGNKIVLLFSSMPGNLQVSNRQARLDSIFRHGLGLQPGSNDMEIVDGCDADLQTLRNDLFRISGQHAVYPQVFFLPQGQDIQFLGDYETVVEMHDSRVLPQRIGLKMDLVDEEQLQKKFKSLSEEKKDDPDCSESTTLTLVATASSMSTLSPSTRTSQPKSPMVLLNTITTGTLEKRARSKNSANVVPRPE